MRFIRLMDDKPVRHGEDRTMITTGPEEGGSLGVDLTSLSEREREVLEAALGGASVRDLAAQLSLTEATVRSHLAHIYAKLGVAGRVELLARLKGHAPEREYLETPEEPNGPSAWRRHRRALGALGAGLVVLAAFAWWRPDLPPTIDSTTLAGLAGAGQITALDVRGDRALVTTADGRSLRVDGLNPASVEAIKALTIEHSGTVAISAADPTLPGWLPIGATALAPVVLALVLGALSIRWIRAHPTRRAPPAGA